jgi:hypothetical protein
MRFAILFVIACGGSAPPAKPASSPAPSVAPKPARPSTAFGRYTAIGPEGYKVDPRTDNVVFESGSDIMMMLLDGADQEPSVPTKCLGQLSAFAAGVLTGISGTQMTVDVVAGTPLPNGCKLKGTSSVGSALVEAAVLDLGGGGVAFAILLHKRPEDGASAQFRDVVTSIAKR